MYQEERVIGPGDLEARYKHVHHADSLKIFEHARVALLQKIGFPMEWFFERNLFPVVTSVTVRYLREVCAGLYRVTCENPHAEDKALFVEQEILNERGKVAVRATVEWKIMDGTSKRAVVPPIEFLDRYLGANR